MERERFEVVVLNSKKTRAIGNGAHILSLYSSLEVDVIDTIRGHSLICFFSRHECSCMQSNNANPVFFCGD